MRSEATRLALLVALDEAIDLASDGWERIDAGQRLDAEYDDRIASLRATLAEFDDR